MRQPPVRRHWIVTHSNPPVPASARQTRFATQYYAGGPVTQYSAWTTLQNFTYQAAYANSTKLLDFSAHVYLATNGYSCGMDFQVVAVPDLVSAPTQGVACCNEVAISEDKRIFLSDNRIGVAPGTLLKYSLQYKGTGTLALCSIAATVSHLRMVVTEIPPS